MNVYTPLTLSILDPLYVLFGWILRLLYGFVANYGWDIIIFTVFFRAIMIPFSIKSHKTQLKQMQLGEELNELRRLYGDDRNGFSMAQMELFKKHKISMMGGCLPSLVSLIVVLPIWRIISQPLHFIMGVGMDKLGQLGQKMVELGLVSQDALGGLNGLDIPILQALGSSGEAMNYAVQNQIMGPDQLINLNFLGLNLGMRPSFSPSQLFGPESHIYLPLLIIPVLAVITSFLTGKVMQWTSPTFIQARRSKELAAKNPARDVMQDQTQGMMKGMNLMMPLFTLMTVFGTPAAMGLYWVVGNVMMIAQSYIFYYFYTKPVFRKIKEQGSMEILDSGRNKK